MAPLVPTIEPVQATAGSTWTWKLTSGTYPVAEGWTLSYAINGPSRLQWSASYLAANGETVTIPTTATVTLVAGTYEITRIWTGSGTYSGRRDTEACPLLAVAPNPATAAAGDRVAWAEANLAAVEAAITARVAGDEPQEYQIGGRSVVKMTLKDLTGLRGQLRSELAILRGRRPAIAIRFTRPSA